MKVLVTGANGQLGHDVVNRLKEGGHTVLGVDIQDMDITDASSVNSVMGNFMPQAVIHCAAWTAVDAAEDAANYAKVRAVNVTGTKNIASFCASTGAKLIYISTDYVFGGKGQTPWQPSDKPDPLNVYGLTKYLGELEVLKAVEKYFIVRIAWVFGVNGKNFVKTMLNLGKTHPEVRVVNDQIGTPTYTYDLAVLLAQMLLSEKYGIYHATNEGGYISWYDFACEIYRQAGLNVKVTPVTTAEYGAYKAVRPFNSRLNKQKLAQNGFTPLPDWKNALSRFLKELSYGTD